MFFRPVAGSLDEAMAQKQEITTFQELHDLLNHDFIEQYAEMPLQISFEYQCWDSRINWDSWLVCIKFKDYETPQAAGYLSDNPDKLIRDGSPDFFEKKAKEAKDFLDKHGLPDGF